MSWPADSHCSNRLILPFASGRPAGKDRGIRLGAGGPGDLAVGGNAPVMLVWVRVQLACDDQHGGFLGSMPGRHRPGCVHGTGLWLLGVGRARRAGAVPGLAGEVARDDTRGGFSVDVVALASEAG
jgi:hypothetical protein